MNARTLHYPRFFVLLPCLYLLLTVSGCRWLGTQTRAEKNSRDGSPEECSEVRKENARLKAQVTSHTLDLAKLRAEYKNQVELNEYRREELRNMTADLEYVEKQFVNLELSIQAEETRASAVAAVAEAQLLFEKMQSQVPDALDSLTVLDIKNKLQLSDDLVKSRNFAAAVYYANRTQRILNLAERKKNIRLDGATRVVSVARANMREGPGARFSVVYKVEFGAVLVQVDNKRDWYKVTTPDGKTGWIHASLVR